MISKVIYGNRLLIDLTDDTVTADSTIDELEFRLNIVVDPGNVGEEGT